MTTREKLFTDYNKEAGDSGERYFGRALARGGFENRYSVFHTLNVPGFSIDIDFALAGGNRVMVIDVKRWQPATYWSVFGYLPMRDRNPLLKAEGPWKLSRSTQMAVEKLRALLPGVEVRACVAFVPVSDKKGKRDVVPNVRWLWWPGGYRSYACKDALQLIDDFLPANVPANENVLRELRKLQRKVPR